MNKKCGQDINPDDNMPYMPDTTGISFRSVIIIFRPVNLRLVWILYLNYKNEQEMWAGYQPGRQYAIHAGYHRDFIPGCYYNLQAGKPQAGLDTIIEL